LNFIIHFDTFVSYIDGLYLCVEICIIVNLKFWMIQEFGNVTKRNREMTGLLGSH